MIRDDNAPMTAGSHTLHAAGLWPTIERSGLLTDSAPLTTSYDYQPTRSQPPLVNSTFKPTGSPTADRTRTAVAGIAVIDPTQDESTLDNTGNADTHFSMKNFLNLARVALIFLLGVLAGCAANVRYHDEPRGQDFQLTLEPQRAD